MYEAALRRAMGDDTDAEAGDWAYGDAAKGEKGVLSDVVDGGTLKPSPGLAWWALFKDAVTSMGGCAAFCRRKGEGALGWRAVGP